MAERGVATSPAEPWTLLFPERIWKRLYEHLFPGDGDEHGAVVLAGVAAGPHGSRLLAREVICAEDGVDYVDGTYGYRALSPLFIARVARRAQLGGWAYLAAHCHGGTDRVGFSHVDLESHERGYPALRQLIGCPIGGLVFAKRAAAGDIWTMSGERVPLDRVTIIGENIVNLSSGPGRQSQDVEDVHDRQARILGPAGQERLESLRVGVVGLGGAGSMAAEMLVRLGVRDLVFIDPDRLEISNVSRVVGSHVDDASGSTARRPVRWLRRARTRRSPRLKIDIAAENAARTGLRPRVETLALDVSEPIAAQALVSCDWIVLAADSQTARHVVNAVAHAFLIPVLQVGVKVPVDAKTGDLGEIFCVARRVTPDAGCLWCNGLIDATELQLEAMGDEGARARAYVGPDAPAPSVITLNGLSVSLGLSELLMSLAGLITSTGARSEIGYQRLMPRSHKYRLDEPRRDPNCFHCGNTEVSLLARGDSAVLPIRTSR